jgi:hypothetical protein
MRTRWAWLVAWIALLALPACERACGPEEARDAALSSARGVSSGEPALVRQVTSPPMPVPAPRSEDGAPVGTAHSFLLEATDPGGRWVVLCQPREDTDGDGKISARIFTHGDLHGDRVDPYLVRGAGDGERLDAYVASSASGRYIAVLRRGRLVLIDAEASTELELEGADIRDDGSPFEAHRAAAFDDVGDAMVYHRLRDGRGIAVVRDLKTGKETEVDPGPGSLWRAEVAPGGGSIAVRIVARDTDGSGELEWPTPDTSLAHRRCRGSGSYSVMGRKGDLEETRIISLKTGKSTVVPGVESALSDEWIVREEAAGDGGKEARLLRISPEGILHELASASCEGQVRHVDHGRALALVACAGREGPRRGSFHPVPLELHGKNKHAPLSAQVNNSSMNGVSNGAERFLWIYPISPPPEGSKENAQGEVLEPPALVDLDRPGTILRFENRDWVVAVHGSRALLQTSKGLVVRDLVIGRDEVIGDWERVGAKRQMKRYVVLSQRVIDLEKASVIGRVRGEVFAVSTDGRPLVGPEDQKPFERNELSIGPLRWVRPTPEGT